MSGGIIRTMSPDDMLEQTEELAATFRQYGALIFRGFFAEDERFRALHTDLERFVRILGQGKAANSSPPPAGWSDRVVGLAAGERAQTGLFRDLAGQPPKLLSSAQVRTHPALLALVYAIFGDHALLSGLEAGDTFQVFPPGAEGYGQTLPIHQDYPYLMQSPAMITAWINFGETDPDAGGLTLWPGSHKLGLRAQRRTSAGHLEVVDAEDDLCAVEEVDVVAEMGDLVLMDALLWYRSNPNLSQDKTRVVQHFRYCDLSHPVAIKHQWLSSDAGGGSLTFEQAYPELLTG